MLYAINKGYLRIMIKSSFTILLIETTVGSCLAKFKTNTSQTLDLTTILFDKRLNRQSYT